MKQSSKNEIDLPGLMDKIQEQLVLLNRKIDALLPAKPPQDQNHGRQMHTAICADCKKECKIPFKPSGDRPVYCQDCFSRRKVIRLSGITSAPAVKEVAASQPPAKTKKKAVPAKKTTAKKKPVPKKK